MDGTGNFKNSKTLYLSDLDGTLLGADSKLSAKSAELLNFAVSNGVLFSVATARTPATVGPLLRDVQLNIPLIVMTGSALWNSSDGTFSHIRKIPSQDVSALADIYRQHGLSAFIYTINRNNVIDILHIGEMSRLERSFMMERIDSPYKHFEVDAAGNSVIPEDAFPDASLFFSMQPTEVVRPVYQIIKHDSRFRPVFYHDMFGDEIAEMEVFSPKASKANAAALLKDITGADRIVAFGDNVNDLPLLEIADVAVAVDNAIPDVRDVADVVIGPNTENSVAEYIINQEFDSLNKV